MYAYMMVLPTNLNPRFFKSLLSASDSGDVVGISSWVFQFPTMGLLSTNCQIYVLKVRIASAPLEIVLHYLQRF